MPRLQYNLDEISSVTIEPGAYRARLMKVEQTLSSNNNPMYVWHWKITEPGDAKGKTMRSWTVLMDTNMIALKEHLEALGLSGKVDTDTTKLIGRFATLIVGTDTTEREIGDEVIVRELSSVAAVRPARKKTRKMSRRQMEELETDYPEVDEDEYEEDDDYDEDEDEYYEDEDDDDEYYDDDEDEYEEDDDEEEEPEPEPKARRRRPQPSRAEQRRSKKKKKSSKNDKLPF